MTVVPHRAAGTILLLGCLAVPVIADAPLEGKLASAWADLASADEGKVARAILVLAAAPKQAVPLLQKQLRPVKVDPKRVAALIKELDADAFADRESAYRELEYLGKFVKEHLERAAASASSLEVKMRLRRLLEALAAENPKPPAPGRLRGGRISVSTINGEVRIMVDGKELDLTPRVLIPKGPLPAWQRAVRAVAVLEHIATPEARKILEEMASGEADAPPTRAASEALKRMTPGRKQPG